LAHLVAKKCLNFQSFTQKVNSFKLNHIFVSSASKSRRRFYFHFLIWLFMLIQRCQLCDGKNHSASQGEKFTASATKENTDKAIYLSVFSFGSDCDKDFVLAELSPRAGLERAEHKSYLKSRLLFFQFYLLRQNFVCYFIKFCIANSTVFK